MLDPPALYSAMMGVTLGASLKEIFLRALDSSFELPLPPLVGLGGGVTRPAAFEAFFKAFGAGLLPLGADFDRCLVRGASPDMASYNDEPCNKNSCVCTYTFSAIQLNVLDWSYIWSKDSQTAVFWHQAPKCHPIDFEFVSAEF